MVNKCGETGDIGKIQIIWFLQQKYWIISGLREHQLVTSQKPQTNELLQRKVTQTKKGNTKHNQTTTILFFTLLLICGFLETIQIQTQEENIG